MESKHTPGPWTYMVVEDQNMISIQSEIPTEEQINNEDTSITGIWGSFHRDNEVDLANAKLIAAAPDLLEACKWAMDQFKRMISSTGIYPENLTQENGGDGFVRIVNAINKATK